MRLHVERPAVVLAAIALTAAVASAQQPVSNLRVSLSSDGTRAGHVFPMGTQAVYAVFTYADLANDRVSATIEGRGLVDLATTSTRLTGTSVGSLELTGAMMYKSAAARLMQEAEQARDNANRASTATVGLQEYLQQVLASAYGMAALLDYMSDVSVSEVASQQTGAGLRSAAELTQLAGDALRLSGDDTAGRQAKAEAMKRPASALVACARLLDQAAATLTAAAIAESPDENDYTVQVAINGLPSASVDFRISPDTRVYLPRVAKPLR
jgi:hypothetical protein